MRIRSIICITTAILVTVFVQPGRAADLAGYSGVNLNVRSGPSVRFPAVGVLGAGTALTIHGCLARYTWCDVSASGLRGWALGAHVQIAHAERRVYVPAYAQELEIPVITFRVDNYWHDHYRDYQFYNELDRWTDYRWEDD